MPDLQQGEEKAVAPIALRSERFRIVVSPEYGATILAAEYRRPDESWEPILEPLSHPELGLNGGCFVMAPFANRIRGGRFSFAGREIVFPMNRPSANMACHGLARERRWTVAGHDATTALLHCEIQQTGYPWHCRIIQRLKLYDVGFSVELAIENRGDYPLPFGIGLHPWFPRAADTEVILSVDGAYAQDELGLPVPRIAAIPNDGREAPLKVNKVEGFDGCLAGWRPRSARISWPARAVGVTLTAHGDLRHAHLFVPRERAVFCLEPVSHAPDVVNRPEIGQDVAMKTLGPGQTMAGKLEFLAYDLKSSSHEPTVSPHP